MLVLVPSVHSGRFLWVRRQGECKHKGTWIRVEEEPKFFCVLLVEFIVYFIALLALGDYLTVSEFEYFSWDVVDRVVSSVAFVISAVVFGLCMALLCALEYRRRRGRSAPTHPEPVVGAAARVGHPADSTATASTPSPNLSVSHGGVQHIIDAAPPAASKPKKSRWGTKQ